jgi:hypothetical protein
MPDLEIAAKKFDSWMKKYEESIRKKGFWDDHNKALLKYLNSDAGFKYVKSYEELCELSSLLHNMGYSTDNPPCKAIDFSEAVQNADPRSFGGQAPKIPATSRLEIAAKAFDTWMKKYEESIREHGLWDNPNKALVDFLNADSGFKYVKSYEELCEVSSLLQNMGYITDNPPCKSIEFSEAVMRADPRVFDNQVPKIPPADRLEIAAKKFDAWMKKYEEGIREHGLWDDPNKALVDFLNADSGFKYINNYTDFCKLADLVKEKGYSTTNPPCYPEKFNDALDQYRKRKNKSHGTKAVPSLLTLSYGVVKENNLPIEEQLEKTIKATIEKKKR